MRWMLRTGIVLAILASAAWIFRVDIVLFGVSHQSVISQRLGRTKQLTGLRAPVSGIGERPQYCADTGRRFGLERHFHERADPTTQTPNIDALALMALRLQGYAANGTCAPSRAALMSGRYGTRFGFEFTPRHLA